MCNIATQFPLIRLFEPLKASSTDSGHQGVAFTTAIYRRITWGPILLGTGAIAFNDLFSLPVACLDISFLTIVLIEPAVDRRSSFVDS
ncbi:Uncharacterized protein HZ326_20143 [Fusarium oxysporum f. sp. albedinis]|nr:Uncharacterized protein HZ326_20143 [Fusarium oxysporum f. sp. albedinis]